MTIAARIPRMITTIRISTSVKPLFVRLMELASTSAIYLALAGLRFSGASLPSNFLLVRIRQRYVTVYSLADVLRSPETCPSALPERHLSAWPAHPSLVSPPLPDYHER